MDISERIQALITEHLAEHGGGMVTAFHLAAEYVNSEGEESWMYRTAPDQGLTRTLGLIEWSRGVAKHEQRRYLQGMDGDDW